MLCYGVVCDVNVVVLIDVVDGVVVFVLPLTSIKSYQWVWIGCIDIGWKGSVCVCMCNDRVWCGVI